MRQALIALIFSSLVAIAMQSLAARPSAEIRKSDLPFNECSVFISGYQKKMVWDDSRVRILISAANVCGGHPGGMLELNDVQLLIESGDRQIAHLHSPTGLLSSRQGKFILGNMNETYGPFLPPATRSQAFREILPTQTLQLDFFARNVRSPNGLYLDLSHGF